LATLKALSSQKQEAAMFNWFHGRSCRPGEAGENLDPAAQDLARRRSHDKRAFLIVIAVLGLFGMCALVKACVDVVLPNLSVS
jgi:hypothetical protein